jgi:hypothetical protein
MRARVKKLLSITGEDSARGFFALVFMIVSVCGSAIWILIGMAALFAWSGVAGWAFVVVLMGLWFWWLTS